MSRRGCTTLPASPLAHPAAHVVLRCCPRCAVLLQGESVFERDQAVARRTTVMPPLPEDRFLCSFSHIFAGGYSSG